MRIFDLLCRRGTLTGTIVPSGLPPCLRLGVSIALCRTDEPIPRFARDYRDQVNIRALTEKEDRPLTFSIKRRAGGYFVAVNLMALLPSQGERKTVHTEWFYPMEEPCLLPAGGKKHLALKVVWPERSPDEIVDLGAVHPDGTASPPETSIQIILAALRCVGADQIAYRRDPKTKGFVAAVSLRPDQVQEVLVDRAEFVREAAVKTGIQIEIRPARPK